MWMMLDPRCGLSLESAADDSLGEPPEWMQYELENIGWSYILDVGHGDAGALRWCLLEGIAPGQPFLVELPHPDYYTSQTEYGVEHDVDFSPEIIDRVFWPMTRAAKAIERELKTQGDDRRAKAEREEKLRFLQRIDVDAMRVCCTVYFGNHQSTYDDMCMPSGIRYTLETTASLEKKRGWTTGTLASGDDDNGGHDVAMKRLVEDALQKLPGLDEERIKKMPRRSGSW